MHGEAGIFFIVIKTNYYMHISVLAPNNIREYIINTLNNIGRNR